MSDLDKNNSKSNNDKPNISNYLIEQELSNILARTSPEIFQALLELSPSRFISKKFFIENLDKIIINLRKKRKEQEIEELKKLLNFRDKDILIEIEEKQKSEKNLEKNKEKEKIIDGELKTDINYDRFKEKGIEIIKLYNLAPKKISVEDFVRYFRSRYNILKNFFHDRDLPNITLIGKISGQRKNISIIGMVYDIRYTKNKNILFEVEDLTGKIVVIIHREKKEIFEKAKQVVRDEIIAIKGSGNNEIFFANEIFFPEIYIKERKKGFVEEYALFLADLHIGSSKFLENNFLKFIKWLNLELGNEQQKEIAKKAKYLFIVGDLIDGAGVYPGQEFELAILDIKKQYAKAAELIGKIRKDITIVICPGNYHDNLRPIEPLPPLDKELAAPFYKMDNVMLLTNPAMIKLGKTNEFDGYKVMLYHGFSYDDYGNEIDYLRMNNALKRPEIIIKFLLQKRHLAPLYSTTFFVPYDEDYLVIKNAPDLFVSGHLHKSAIFSYNNIQGISCSCWQAKTKNQERLGHEPDPCKVPIFNLKTGKVSIIDFS